MTIVFKGIIWYWRGPAPWYFVTIPAEESDQVKGISRAVTYGWGVIPVVAQIGRTTWKTSLIPKEDRYLVPIKAQIRNAEQLANGDEVLITLEI